MRAPLPSRLLAALPDAVTAAFFLVLWVQPSVFGAGALRTGLLIMLVEFILLHASAMIGGSVLGRTPGTRLPWKLLLGFAAMYLVFIAAYAWAFRQWWPLLAFGWLLLGKASLAFDRELPTADRAHRLQSGWAVGCLAYLVGASATIFVPLPRLGLTSAIVAQAELAGSGHWVSYPHTVVAFGLFYFAVLALVKTMDFRLGPPPKLR